MDPEDKALLGRLDERTERIVKVLEGNGKLGLVDRVDSLEASRDSYRGAEAQRAKYMKLITWLGGGGGITGLATAIWHFFAHK